MIGEALTQIPSTKDQIITSLKERIESGSYYISGERIAEAMVRHARTNYLN
jgi:anti-sigma28 factor (negative regulator of flagellin synthesis)